MRYLYDVGQYRCKQCAKSLNDKLASPIICAFSWQGLHCLDLACANDIKINSPACIVDQESYRAHSLCEEITSSTTSKTPMGASVQPQVENLVNPFK